MEYLGPYNHPLNESKRKKILVSSWDFGPSYPQGERKDYPKSTNPAKMRPSLVRAILQIYGEAPVLDPMAGSFTTCMEASKLGMKSYGVEFELKFIKEAMKWRGGKAPIHFIRGDARELSKIFCKDRFGNVALSPPYWRALHDTKEKRSMMGSKEVSANKGPCGYSENKENIANISNFGSIVFSPPYFIALSDKAKSRKLEHRHAEIQQEKRIIAQAYSESDENIGNVPVYGENALGSILFSPPYFKCFNAKQHTLSGMAGRDPRLALAIAGGFGKSEANIGNIVKYGMFGSIILSPPYFDAVQAVSPGHQGPEYGCLDKQHLLAKTGKSGYGSERNIGHLKNYGMFGSIVFSPPYAGNLTAKKNTKSFMSKEERLRWAAGEPLEKKGMSYSPDPKNIGNVSDYGAFGSIVFSPPYSEGIGHVAGKNASDEYAWRLNFQRRMTEAWSKGNIANLKHGDVFNSVIFSPPFGEANKGGGIARKGYEGKHGKDVELKNRCDRPLSNNPNNIGNKLYGRTYLSEMQKVYAECFKVLKPGKFMVVVVKDIRRNKLTIPLGADTIKLCQSVGFQCYEIIVNKMYFPSFWMLHHAKKMQGRGEPMALKVHEYIIVMRKPNR
jgi:DNA modification methylase